MATFILSPGNPMLQPGTVTLAPLRTKSVAPGPQNSTLIFRAGPVVSPALGHREPAADRDGHQVITYSDEVSGLDGQCGAISLIQRSSGCRVSEALRLSSSDIVPPDTLIIRSLKGSRPRAVRVPELQVQFNLALTAGPHPLFRLSYSQVYRHYRRNGILSLRPGQPYDRVTHTYRHSFIKNVHQCSKDLDTTRDVVGHRSRRSTLIYLEKGTSNG